MPTGITGKDIRGIRKTLGLSIDQFARSLGVHPVTLNRWELKHDDFPIIDGAAWPVLVGLQERLAARGPERKEAKAEAKATGDEIVKVLAVGGVLLALAALVVFAAKRR